MSKKSARLYDATTSELLFSDGTILLIPPTAFLAILKEPGKFSVDIGYRLTECSVAICLNGGDSKDHVKSRLSDLDFRFKKASAKSMGLI